MKVIICGSRNIYLERNSVEEIVHRSGFEITSLICGMCIGVDMSAFDWAYPKNIPIIEKPYKSQYDELGGQIRNQEMVDIADAWIGVISDTFTKGTKDCYNRAIKANLPVYIHNIEGLL